MMPGQSARIIDVDYMNKCAEEFKKEIKPQPIRCPNGHKVAEKKDGKICIKCKCKHVVEV